jgi:hypothetical protein
MIRPDARGFGFGRPNMPRPLGEIMEASARGRSPLRGEGSVEDLRRCWEGADGSARPFMDFVPIRLVTILENSVRDVVAQAVDYGEPYASRGLSLIARFPAKALVDTLPAVKQERITLGDLASRGFSTGRMDEIIGALTTIFGDGFRNEFASVRTLWSEDEGYISEEKPGSIAPLLYAIEMTRLARWRVDDIKRLKSRPEGHL